MTRLGIAGRLLPVLIAGLLPVGAASQVKIDPWEVRLYRKQFWVGEFFPISMGEVGMRQKVVDQLWPDWDDQVVSIAVGEKVAVAVFAHPHWESGGWTCADEIITANASRVKEGISSLIVFPKNAGYPLGVCMWDIRSISIEHVTFFPLPERDQETESFYASLGHVNLDRNANGIRTFHANVEVTLYSGQGGQGASLTLPGPAGWAVIDPFWNGQRELLVPMWSRGVNFGTFQWSDTAASLKVRWTGPPLNLGPQGLTWPEQNSFDVHEGLDMPGSDYKSFAIAGGPKDCEKACGIDPVCKAFTWVKRGEQAPSAQCWLKSAAPTAVPRLDCVSGLRRGLPMRLKVTAPPSPK